MRVPHSWLKDYLPTDISPEDLAEVLTMGGLEVEEIDEWTSEDGAASDLVLITSVTANRGDLLSMFGGARHAASLLDATASLPRYAISATDEPARAETDLEEGDTRITLECVEGCPRYSGLRVTGVKIAPSPDWLAHRLEAAGIRPVNNVVDATNYVLWELGQPLHAFDHRLVVDGHIIVRRAEAGEKLVTIDETERALTPDDLVIADRKGAVALAGVMGGVDSEMRDRTTEVLIESAHFDPTMVRKTAMRLGMGTEASYRFERHVDPNLTLPALARAAELILETAGGEVVGPALDVCARDFEPLEIELRPERTNALLGTGLSADEQAALLTRIGFEVQSGEALSVRVPTARRDIEREVDLIEEVAILHGYNNIGTTLPGGASASGLLTRDQRLEERARAALRATGLRENVSFSMISERDLDTLGLPADAAERRALELRDPMSADEALLRTTMLPSILRAARYNARRRVRDIALFEIGRVFLPGDAQLPDEPLRLAALITGTPLTSTWNVPDDHAEADFFWLKGAVEQMAGALCVDGLDFTRADHPSMAAGRCAEIAVAGERIGVIGELSGEVRDAWDLPGATYVAELDMSALIAAGSLDARYEPLPRQPAALRDLAVVVDDDDAHAAGVLEDALRSSAGDALESVEVFDVYVDEERLGRGKRQVALRLSFRLSDRTLTDEEVDAAMASVTEYLASDLDATMRSW